MKQWIGSVALLALLMVGIFIRPVRGQGETPCPGDMSYTEGYLTNGGFEEGFHPEAFDSEGNDLIGDGWTQVTWNGNPNWTSMRESSIQNGGHLERIECEEAQLIRSENFDTVGGPYDTVLLQRVTGLTPGQAYSFSGWVLKIWGGSYQPGREEPRDPHAMGSWIGVDPTGSTDPSTSTVLWSAPDWDDEVQAHWANHRMAVVPEGEALTVFVRIQQNVAKSHTVAFVDGMELYDAPRVTLQTQSGYTTESAVTLRWSGVIPQSLQERGESGSVFRLYSAVQQQQSDGNWRTLETIETVQSDLSNISATVPISVPEGEKVHLRVAPYTYERLDLDGRTKPPTWHVGPATEPITITRGEPGPPLTEHVYLPLIVR